MAALWQLIEASRCLGDFYQSPYRPFRPILMAFRQPAPVRINDSLTAIRAEVAFLLFGAK
jgi:hypothetical protein